MYTFHCRWECRLCPVVGCYDRYCREYSCKYLWCFWAWTQHCVYLEVDCWILHFAYLNLVLPAVWSGWTNLYSHHQSMRVGPWTHLFTGFVVLFLLLHDTAMFVSMLKNVIHFMPKRGNVVSGLRTQFILRFHLSQLEEFNQADLLELLHSGSWPSRLSSNCSIFTNSFPSLPGIAPESYWLNVKRICCWPSIRFAKIVFIWTILFWLQVHLFVT